jgi:hypothetical protein
MAVDLKTLTPTSPLAKTGFLFGAESQDVGTTNPSVYSTQAVARTLLGSTSLTGDVLTADAPVLNLTQTWNNGAVTFTGVRFNAAGTSNANSSSTSLLIDLQVNGVSKFKVGKDSIVYNVLQMYKGNTQTGVAINLEDVPDGFTATGATLRIFSAKGSPDPGITLNSAYALGWSASDNTRNAYDTVLTRKAERNLRLGLADAASALAQTLSVQSVVANTTNGAGAAFTINGSQGTGSGAGGSIIFQTAPANTGGGATIQNVLAPALTIVSDKSVRSGNAIFQDGYLSLFVNVSDAQSLNFTQRSIIFSTGISNSAITLNANGVIGFTSATSGDVGVIMDTILRRDDANILAQRNGVNAQTFRVYNTYTDGSNYERLSFAQVSSEWRISSEAAGSGSVRSVAIYAGATQLFQFATGSSYFGSNLNANVDNTYDIGAASNYRPRYIRAVSAIVTAPRTLAAGASQIASAATAGAGARSFVTDASMSMTLGVGTVATAGGANAVPVYSDGTNWLIG